MNIITDTKQATAFLKNMEASLGDTAYWKNWYFVDVHNKTPLDWIKQAKISTQLRTVLPDDDGSILWLDGYVAAFFQSAAPANVTVLRNSLSKVLGENYAQLDLYPIFEDAATVQKILALRRGKEEKVRELPAANYRFLKSLIPNVDDLLRNWHKEKLSRTGRSKPVVMIVDDDQFVLTLVSRALSAEADIVTAHNGAEAIANHLEQMPDIIFLDIGLPDCDGLTVLNYMQQYDTECRIVMFSADSFVNTRVKALASGAKGFIPKPFNLGEFQKQIAAWFSGNTKSQ